MSTTETTALATTPEFVARFDLVPPLEVGPGPYGARIVFGFAGGRIEGERLKADVLPGGADAILVGADGYGRLDVRAAARTDDGVALYVTYTGIIEMNATVGGALETGGGTEFSDQYCRVAVRFEAADERYAWLNQHLFVAEGRVQPGAIEYRVHRVV